MLRSSMVALYELFLTVLGRDKLTPAVAELLLLLTSKSEVNNCGREGWKIEEKTSRYRCGGWLQCRRCEPTTPTPPSTPWSLGFASSGLTW